MTPSRELIERMTRESRRAQGLPPVVEDPEPLRQIADLIDDEPQAPATQRTPIQRSRKSA